jgi:plasmid stability protein
MHCSSAHRADVLLNLATPYELVFVDDGSVDNSWQTLASLTSSDPRVKALTGVDASSGDIVLTMDADLQDPPRAGDFLRHSSGRRGCYHDIEQREAAVAQLLVRNLDDHVKAELRRRARKHGRSTEEEVRDILRVAVNEKRTTSLPLGARFRARFARIGLDDNIQELRGHMAQPAPFKR